MLTKSRVSIIMVSLLVLALASAFAMAMVRVTTGSAILSNEPSKPPPTVQTPKKSLPVGVSESGNKTFYTVQPFDVEKKQGTLTFIAGRFHTSVGNLVRLNPQISDPDLLRVGQRIRVK